MGFLWMPNWTGCVGIVNDTILILFKNITSLKVQPKANAHSLMKC